MSCPDVGTLRAYLDRELPARRADEVARHIGGCESCRERLAELEKVAGFAGARLSRLSPSTTEQPAEAPLALARLRRRSSRREGLGSRLAGALAALTLLLSPARLSATAVSAALVVAILFTPVGGYAQGLLSVFRAQNVQAVQIDPTTIMNLPTPEDLGTLKVTSKPEFKSATLAEAGKEAGLSPQTLSQAPAGYASSPIVGVTTQVTGSFTYVLSKVKAYYQKRGLTTQPPAELNGLTVDGTLPPVVLQVYADQATLNQLQQIETSKATPTSADQKALANSHVLVFAQVRSPNLEMPGDAAAIRQQILNSGALPPELALQLEAIGNWQTTLPIPVLPGTSKNVTVDGVHGVLVTDKQGSGSWLIWLKNGVVYGIGGNVSESAILDAAQHLK